MIDFAQIVISEAKKALHLYFEEKDMKYLLSRCIHDDIPLIGIIKPNWTSRLCVYSEHYQFYRQSENGFLLYGKLTLREISDNEEHKDTIQNITMNCMLSDRDIMFTSIHMSSVTEDAISQNVNAEEIRNFYHSAVEKLYDVLIEYDNINNSFYYTADKFHKMFNAEGHFVNMDQIFWYLCTECIHPEDVEKMDVFRNVDLEKRIRNQECKICYDIRVKTENQKYKWVEVTIVLFPDEEHRINKAFMLFRDIDEKKKQDLATLSSSRTDSLTGICNRVYAEALITHSLSNQKKVSAMLLLDIDNFKQVNDTFGHLTGDEILRKIVSIVSDTISERDIFGRVGGDEFIVFLREREDAREIENIIQKIQKNTVFLHEENRNTLQIHTSIGAVVVYPDKNPNSFEKLYRESDVALYAVKENGKNNYKLIQQAE